MAEYLLVGLTAIAVLGIGAQWLAWRFKLPSILLLLVFGLAAGPWYGFLEPQVIFGETLLPFVSLAVALILFEGGLDLRIADLRAIGPVVRNLIFGGSLITWVLAAAAAYWILGFDGPLAVLVGALLVVTGPTVVIPLLRHVRPRGRVGTVAKWEGIMNDPVGAVLTVLVFEAISLANIRAAATAVVVDLLQTLGVGIGLGAAGAGLMVLLLRRHWVPDFLQSPMTLMVVVAVFTASNLFQHESGLLTVTLMGVILANQRWVVVKHIAEFKENLRVLLISSLFILLAARLERDDLLMIGWESVAFVAVLILVVRPVTVAISCWGTDTGWKERVFLAWMAPRGIVAAAIATIFAGNLAAAGHAQAQMLVPVVFAVVAGTVAVYGLTAMPVARLLGLAEAQPQGVLVMGAHALGRQVAEALKAAGVQILLADTNWQNISAARMAGLPTYYGNILAEAAGDEMELGGVGRLLALTPNDEANSLATLHYADLFGRGQVYQLAPAEVDGDREERFSPQHLRGRFLWGHGVSYGSLVGRLQGGAVVKTVKLTERFALAEFERLYPEAVLLFVMLETGELLVPVAGEPLEAKPGQTLIGLVQPVEERPDGPEKTDAE